MMGRYNQTAVSYKRLLQAARALLKYPRPEMESKAASTPILSAAQRNVVKIHDVAWQWTARVSDVGTDSAASSVGLFPGSIPTRREKEKTK